LAASGFSGPAILQDAHSSSGCLARGTHPFRPIDMPATQALAHAALYLTAS
jgi:hypothetical protein